MKKKTLNIIIPVILLIICALIGWYLGKKTTIFQNIFNIPINRSNGNDANKEDKPVEIVKVSEYYNPIVPEGFKKVETDTASWDLDENGNPKGWNNGLVIEDKDGNQFVWFPYNYNENHISENYNSKYCNSIKKYSGFYVGRYEAGLPENLQENLQNISPDTNDISGKPIIRKGSIPWNFINIKNALYNAENMYNDSNSFYTTLIEGANRADIYTWIYNTNKNLITRDFGNFADSDFYFTGLYSDDVGASYKYGENIHKTENMILATGITERNKLNNIYDFLGNVAETYVTRITEFNDTYGAYDKDYYSNTSDKYNESENHAWSSSKIGFRVGLYMK